MQQYLGLSKIPHYTTLQKAAARLSHGMLLKILESFVINSRIRKMFAGIDSTGLSHGQASYHYTKRAKLRRKFIKKYQSVQTWETSADMRHQDTAPAQKRQRGFCSAAGTDHPTGSCRHSCCRPWLWCRIKSCCCTKSWHTKGDHQAKIRVTAGVQDQGIPQKDDEASFWLGIIRPEKQDRDDI